MSWVRLGRVPGKQLPKRAYQAFQRPLAVHRHNLLPHLQQLLLLQQLGVGLGYNTLNASTPLGRPVLYWVSHQTDAERHSIFFSFSSATYSNNDSNNTYQLVLSNAG